MSLFKKKGNIRKGNIRTEKVELVGDAADEAVEEAKYDSVVSLSFARSVLFCSSDSTVCRKKKISRLSCDGAFVVMVFNRRREMTKELQKERNRHKGVMLADPTDNVEIAEVVAKSSTVGSEFAVMTGGSFSDNQEASLVEKEMERFIATQLAKREGVHEKEKAVAAVDNRSSLEAGLYDIADNLKVERKEVKESGDRWLTGIAEVSLPIS